MMYINAETFYNTFRVLKCRLTHGKYFSYATIGMCLYWIDATENYRFGNTMKRDRMKKWEK